MDRLASLTLPGVGGRRKETAAGAGLRVSTVLAFRNLVHDRVRLMVTLVGIVFAVILMNVELALFLGFTSATSAVIDHSGADLWVMSTGTRNVDQVVPISERKLYQTLAVPGVEKASCVTIDFAFVKKPDGDTESVLVVGYDLATGLGGPWNIVEGDARNLRYPGTILVDELYREKLGVHRLGDTLEIAGHRARVVGFTRGIRSFTQSPYVFASLRSARTFTNLREDQTKYVLAALKDGDSVASVRRAVAGRVANVDVLTRGEFASATQFYWMFTTGAGVALLVAAVMGLAVGTVVVGQTLYATTIDHLPEFATLRAIGAPRRYIHGVIIRQALLSAIVGYAIGLGFTLAILYAARNAGPALLLPWPVLAGTALTVTLLCVGAALISIRKVMRLDPAVVFK